MNFSLQMSGRQGKQQGNVWKEWSIIVFIFDNLTQYTMQVSLEKHYYH